ncbi:MAG: HlyD family efflux transporter periplasmic adaptor subunit [Salibacteraceae bacterium]
MEEIAASQQTADIIEVPPGWLIHSGIGTIAAVMVMLLGLTLFIRYPDKVLATGMITTEMEPVELFTEVDGRIERLFVKDKATVESGAPILFLANDASWRDVEKLKQQLALLKTSLGTTKDFPVLPELTQLGLMQRDYVQLKQQCEALAILLTRSEVVALQKSTLNKELAGINRLNESLVKEKALFEEELALKKRDFHRHLSLEEVGAVSKLDYENRQLTYLQFQRQFEGMSSGIINNQIRMEQLRMESIRLETEYAQNIQAAIVGIGQTIELLHAGLLVWEQQYFLKAETAGTISLARSISENAFLRKGDLAAYVVPLEKGRLLARIKLPVPSSGKIEIGQRLILKVQEYPYKEFGMVQTKVADIAAIAVQAEDGEAYYDVRGELPDKLITTYGKQIAYKPNMQVSAEIISEDRSLFQRIFSQFLNLIKND